MLFNFEVRSESKAGFEVKVKVRVRSRSEVFLLCSDSIIQSLKKF